MAVRTIDVAVLLVCQILNRDAGREIPEVFDSRSPGEADRVSREGIEFHTGGGGIFRFVTGRRVIPARAVPSVKKSEAKRS